MACSISLPLIIQERIRSAEPPPIADEVRAQIRTIAERPRLGTPQVGGAFDGAFAYQFRIDRLPVSRVFTLLYAYDEERKLIEVVDFGVMEGNPPVLKPPAFKVSKPSC